MKKLVLTFVFSIMVFLFAGVSDLSAQGNYLNVPLVTQEHSQWCWDASSLCIIKYKGGNTSQCTIANYAFNRSDCCGNSYFNWYHSCNQPNTTSAMVSVLSAWGVSASSTGSLSWSSIQSQINANRPFIIGRSGHATVGYGYWTSYGTTYVGHMDPWPGEGYKWITYYSMSSGWFATVVTY